MFAQIKQTINICDIIGRYVTLSRKGSRYNGLCPFHDDHHPSLTVDPQKQNYICYACGAKGDVITFIQEIEKCSAQEALKKLVPSIPQQKAPSIPQRGTDNPIVNKVDSLIKQPRPTKDKNSLMTKQTSPFGGSRGRSFLSTLMPYMSGDHDLSEACLDFEVGTAPFLVPPAWQYMRGRVIFPVRDEKGELVGVAGRKDPACTDDSPKYLNSPGMPRSEILYGLYRARKQAELTGILYLVEGFKDVIAMHAAGLTNTVGLCGTQMSEGQKRLLSRHADRVVVMMDGDAPGRKAAEQIAQTLTASELTVTVIDLPEGSDPDSLFREKGKQAFAAWVRLKTNVPHPTECLLMASLLLYPQPGETAGEAEKPWPEWVSECLIRERITPDTFDHSSLIDHYDKRGATAPLPPSLELIAQHLLEHFGAKANTLCRKQLFSHYCENRLVQSIRTITRSLRNHPGNRRDDLLRELTHRQEQLSRISQRLGRPAAVR